MAEVHAWARHYQSVWQERAANPDLPAWLRVVSLAYGSHKANGHAQFGAGDLAVALGSVDMETGELVEMPRQNVHRTIQTAVRYGWLAEGSTARCLIVPAHAISGGMGSPSEECPLHSRRTRKVRAPKAKRHLKAVSE